MLPIKAISAIALPAMLLLSCAQDSKKTSPPIPPTQTQTPPTALPEIFLYATTVDKLNLREAPDKNAKIITQLAEGVIVEGRGEVSPNREEATLRGLTWNEPYVKINTLAPEKQTGWLYGGAVQKVYAGSRAGSPDLGRLEQLTGFLKTLNAKKLDSGKKAWAFVNTHFANANGSLADAAFVVLENFLRRMEREGEFYKLTENEKWSDADYRAIADRKFDVNKNPLAKSLTENGFELVEGEGMIFPVVDWNKLQAFFSPKASPSMKAYLDQQTAEQNVPAWSDGGIIISLETMADRAAFWEKFNRENPHFLLTGQTKQSEQWMRLVLVNGDDNTPTYDYETQAITDDYKKVWAYIQQKYPGTELAKKAKEIADLCAAEGWKRTKKVEDWQMKYAEETF